MPINIDLLVNGIAVRQTGASFGYDLLKKNSEVKTIKGIQRKVLLRIPKREALIAVKLHAGRVADFRDIAALARDLDLDLLQELIVVGDVKLVREHIQKLLSLLGDREFIDSFKGMFMEKKYDLNLPEIRRLGKLRLL